MIHHWWNSLQNKLAGAASSMGLLTIPASRVAELLRLQGLLILCSRSFPTIEGGY